MSKLPGHLAAPHLAKVEPEARAVLGHLGVQAGRPSKHLHLEHAVLVLDRAHLRGCMQVGSLSIGVNNCVHLHKAKSTCKSMQRTPATSTLQIIITAKTGHISSVPSPESPVAFVEAVDACPRSTPAQVDCLLQVSHLQPGAHQAGLQARTLLTWCDGWQVLNHELCNPTT